MTRFSSLSSCSSSIVAVFATTGTEHAWSSTSWPIRIHASSSSTASAHATAPSSHPHVPICVSLTCSLEALTYSAQSALIFRMRLDQCIFGADTVFAITIRWYEGHIWGNGRHLCAGGSLCEVIVFYVVCFMNRMKMNLSNAALHRSCVWTSHEHVSSYIVIYI